jgi:type II secretion system protein G
MSTSRRGFTLIELLIVVAIIAILAAIAVPNFLEAQTRSKVARVKSEMRTLATALEEYFVDHGEYPLAARGAGVFVIPLSECFIPLTTPVAYITSIPIDLFFDRWETSRYQGYGIRNAADTYNYWSEASAKVYGVTPDANGVYPNLYGGKWRLASAGPDLIQLWGDCPEYDPSNGTKSWGDIVLVQGGGNGGLLRLFD